MEESNCSLQVNGDEKVWARAVSMKTGIHVASCYQCMRCSNSCPVSGFMDIKPHQVVRLVQLGRRDQLLGASSIWLCLSCEMCSTYCPNEIDVAALMDFLKSLVVSTQSRPAELDIATFHEVFLDVLNKNGRLNDLQLIHRHKFKQVMNGSFPSWEELKDDIVLAGALMKRGRLKLFPEKSPAIREIRRMMKQYGQTGVSS